MSSSNDTEGSTSAQGHWFTTTHWSLVLNARDPSSPQAAEALEKLCRTYWYPLYAYVRRQGEDEESAKDLTQEFFARLLEKNYLAQAQRERGKFRAFLLGSLKHFAADEWDSACAQKRGGGQPLISLDDTTCEDRYRLEPVDAMDAEKLYERRWALSLLELARQRLKEEYDRAGKSELYGHLKVYETGDRNGPPYAEVAAKVRLSESGVKSAVHSMRQRFLKLVREEVANTVENPAEVDAEIRHLIIVVSR